MIVSLLWPAAAYASEESQLLLAPEISYEKATALAENLKDYQLILFDERGRYIWPLSFAELGISGELCMVTVGNWHKTSRYAIVLRYDLDHILQGISSLYESYLQAAHDAHFQISYDNIVTIVPEQSGQKLQLAAIRQEIDAAVRALRPNSVIELKSQWTVPEITEDDLKQLEINGLQGEFSTCFDGGNQSRATNIWLASGKIEGVLLRPGETFSFNEVVGPRTKERGFSEAGVIINSQHGIDVGGGVCQVATTLYNAARISGMTIVERHGHSLPVHYVDKGKDAAVVYGEKDLRFCNDSDHTILIKSYFAYGKLTFKIFGKVS